MKTALQNLEPAGRKLAAGAKDQFGPQVRLRPDRLPVAADIRSGVIRAVVSSQ
ncbi:hypothetical protein [Pseudonocardia yunnanensis]|uniref:Uncharacterized protein n=1 Tax=Pseudonocardia yunnanensis TaxID=58107 RepID=A0ABW4EP88_9PSEU